MRKELEIEMILHPVPLINNCKELWASWLGLPEEAEEKSKRLLQMWVAKSTGYNLHRLVQLDEDKYAGCTFRSGEKGVTIGAYHQDYKELPSYFLEWGFSIGEFHDVLEDTDPTGIYHADYVDDILDWMGDEYNIVNNGSYYTDDWKEREKKWNLLHSKHFDIPPKEDPYNENFDYTLAGLKWEAEFSREALLEDLKREQEAEVMEWMEERGLVYKEDTN